MKLLTRPCWDSGHASYGKYGDRLSGWSDFVAKGVLVLMLIMNKIMSKHLIGDLPVIYRLCAGIFRYFSETNLKYIFPAAIFFLGA